MSIKKVSFGLISGIRGPKDQLQQCQGYTFNTQENHPSLKNGHIRSRGNLPSVKLQGFGLNKSRSKGKILSNVFGGWKRNGDDIDKKNEDNIQA